jgi:ribonuclease BN (tRNA processing enzyme)
VIIDAGSGLRELGNALLNRYPEAAPVRADLFLTHTHLDHILGFPFFAPVYLPDTKLRIYGPVTSEEESLETVLGDQLSYRYFPVRQVELAADIEYINLREGRLDLGDGIFLTAKYLNHSLLCFGYRFEYRGKVLCTAFDNEPFYNIFGSEPLDFEDDKAMAHEADRYAQTENRRMEAFFEGADLLIHDAQFTQKEYDSEKMGWGHTAIEYAIGMANRCGVGSLALLHHDPSRTDRQIDKLSKTLCNKSSSGATEAFFAREGMEIIL